MGVYRLRKFVMENKSVYSEIVDTSDKPANVVVDGFSLFYSLSDIVCQLGIEALYSYEAIHHVVYDFMDYLKARNLNLVCVCVDSLYDDDKLEVYLKRHISKTQELSIVWNSDFCQFCYDYLPWFCENAIVLSLREYTNNNIDFRFTGLDPDRDIAKCSLDYSAYVMSNDSDFFVFKINGVIDLSEILSVLSLVPKSIRVYSVNRILQFHTISYEQFLCAALLQGNDFIHGVPYRCISSSKRIASFLDLINYVRFATKNTSNLASFFCSINKRSSPQHFKEMMDKYNLDIYPSFPSSLFAIHQKDLTTEMKAIPSSLLENLQNPFSTYQFSALFNFIWVEPHFVIPLNQMKNILFRYFEKFFLLIDNNTHIPRCIISNTISSNYIPTDSKSILVMKRLSTCLTHQQASMDNKLSILASFFSVTKASIPADNQFLFFVLCVLKDCLSPFFKEEWRTLLSIFTYLVFNPPQKEEDTRVPIELRRTTIIVADTFSHALEVVLSILIYLGVPFDLSFEKNVSAQRFGEVYTIHENNRAKCPHCECLREDGNCVTNMMNRI